jgi:hypothetical protein
LQPDTIVTARLEAPVVFLADPPGAWEHPIDLHIDHSGELIRGYLALLNPDRCYHPKILACQSGWEDLAEAARTFRRAEHRQFLRFLEGGPRGETVLAAIRGIGSTLAP